MIYNKELLLEDITWPLKWDSKEYKMYIFDNGNNMIAQIDIDLDAVSNYHPFEKLIGGYKEVETHRTNPYSLKEGEFIDNETGEVTGRVRGWGRLQYKDRPEERQDNIANYILTVINSQLQIDYVYLCKQPITKRDNYENRY